MKKLQKGRSMIEMLGVLAIVGVLSIGGLAGYQMAMNRYRASSLSDFASRCVVVAQTKTMSGRVPTGEAAACGTILGEPIPAFLGNAGSVTVADTPEGVATVTVAGVPTAVHNVLHDRFTDGNTSLTIGGVSYSKNEAGNSVFTFGQ